MILVTGATGVIGSEVVKQLAAKGEKVRTALHTPGKANQLQSPGLEIVELEDFMIEVGLNMDAFGRAGGFSRITSDFETVTGHKPITFEQFARDYAEQFK